ncbi:MAG: ABC transporter substrate-binding protein [Actinomycetes bacterium]
MTGSAGAAKKSGDKNVFVVGNYEKTGESAQAVPQFEDGAQLAVADLTKQGYTVKYERYPGQSVAVPPEQVAFEKVKAANPDSMIGLTASQLFAIGPTVVASGIPTFALAAPATGIKSGPQGGDNIFLMRPLNDTTAAAITDYACKVLKLKKVGVLAVNLPFGTDSITTAKKHAAETPSCQLVTTQTNGYADADLTQQVLAFKNAGVDGVIGFDYPVPFGVFAKNMQDNGVNVPIIGGASLGIAVASKAITNTTNLIGVDDCVPALETSAFAKKFTKAYKAKYGYLPNYAAAQVYDAFFMTAKATQAVGHDHAAIVKWISQNAYNGVCENKADKNNVLGRSVTAFKWNADGTPKLLKRYVNEYIPPADIVGAVTTVAGATATTAAK